MSLMVFKNKNVSNKSETDFFNYLIEEFRSSPFAIGLFCDVFVESTQIDILLVSEKGIFIVEYKNYSGKLIGSENGKWTVEKIDGKTVEVNSGRENLFQQLRKQRFSVIGFIKNKFNTIFPGSDKESKSIEHIGTMLVFESISKNSEIKISQSAKLWLSVISKEEAKQHFDHLRPSNLTFKEDEIINIASALNLDQVSTEEQISEKEPKIICPVCLYSTDQCIQKFLSGEVIGIEGNVIKMKSNGKLYNILFNKQKQNSIDKTELTILNDIFNYFKTYNLDLPLEINLFHLKTNPDYNFEISEDTLIIILPSWLYSVTDFAGLDFCERNVIANKFSFAPSNKNILRGSAINEALLGLVENPDELNKSIAKSKSYIQERAIDVIGSKAAPVEIDNNIQSELPQISEWAKHYNRRDNIRAEEFMISTILGLKGKIDLVFKDKDNNIVDIIELKSSTPDYFSTGIKEYHELQVAAYGIMVLMKQQKSFRELGGETPSLIYSQSNNGIRKPGRFDSEIFEKVFKFRNILLSMEFKLSLPEPYPHPMIYPKGCERCSGKEICMDICRIVQFEYCDNTCLKHPHNNNVVITNKCILNEGIDDALRKNFRDWIDFLNKIRLNKNKDYANVITLDLDSNKRKGKVLEIKIIQEFLPTTSSKSIIYKFDLPNKNYSEFRDGDMVLLSDSLDLSMNNVEMGTIKKITFEKCEIELKRVLAFYPRYIISYYSESTDDINYAGIYVGFFKNKTLSDLIYKSGEALKSILNNINIELVQGVPGSGKTSEIVHKIFELVEHGKKVYVTAVTNTAINNIHEELLKKDNNISNKIYRFGNINNIKDEFKGFEIKADYHNINELKNEINSKSIFISTIHSSNSATIKNIANYDYVIIDEASQINIPVSFVALNLSNNILLVGDHNQLPPIFSEEILDSDTDRNFTISLFELLWKKTEGLLNANRRRSLNKQYRMNAEIAKYPSMLFYNDLESDSIIKDKKIVFESETWKNMKFSKILNPDIASIWVQVERDNNHHRKSTQEATYCCEIAADFIKSGIKPKQISIIAPFRLQVNQIKNAVYDSLKIEIPDILDRMKIDTIDRFQGSQNDIVIISLCSNQQQDNFLIKDIRRFNVAITRAKYKRIILGDVRAFKNDSNENNKKIVGILEDGYTKLIYPEKPL